jgi:hypothetical protein
MHNKSYLFILFVTLCVAQILAACVAAASTPDPVSVIQGYYDALASRDIDKVMSFWAEDAVYSDEFGVRQSGHEEIRAGVQSAINDGVIVELSNISDTHGRLVYDYQVFVGGTPFLSGTGLTIIQDSKIVFDGTEETWAKECEQDSTQRFCAE